MKSKHTPSVNSYLRPWEAPAHLGCCTRSSSTSTWYDGGQQAVNFTLHQWQWSNYGLWPFLTDPDPPWDTLSDLDI